MNKISLRTVKEFRNGNKEAFEEIFYAYKNKLYYIAYFYVRNYDDANDCVQEIFIRLVNKIHLYDEKKAPFEVWLYALAKSCILNHIRTKENYTKKVTINDEIVYSYMDKDVHDINDILYDLEILMGKQMYVIYMLRITYNLSFEKIAELTNISRETVRRLFLESVNIVNEYMKGEKYEKEQEA